MGHLLFLAILSLTPSVTSWKENEPGRHEKGNFEWILRENEREYGQLSSGECSERWGWKFWEQMKKSRTKACKSVTRFESGPYSLLLMENVSLSSTEQTVDYWMTPFLDSEITVYGECQSFTPSRLFKPFLKQFQFASSSDLEKKCTVRLQK